MHTSVGQSGGPGLGHERSVQKRSMQKRSMQRSMQRSVQSRSGQNSIYLKKNNL